MSSFLGVITTSMLSCILAVLATVLVGFLANVRSIMNIEADADFLDQYRKKFIGWVNSDFQSDPTYIQLVSESPEAQRIMGKWGILGALSLPFGRGTIYNWEIALNSISEIKRQASDYIGRRGTIQFYIQTLDEALLRAIASKERASGNLRKEIWNPVVSFREGAVRILSIPLYFLAHLGVISKSFYQSFISSSVSKLIAILIYFLGITASIAGLVVDWDAFSIKVLQYLS